MLARGGGVSDELRQLLQALFFEAHVTNQRTIDETHLTQAAEAAGSGRETLEELLAWAAQRRRG